MRRVVGINPVRELIFAGKKVEKIEVNKSNNNIRIKEIIEIAQKKEIPVNFVDDKADNDQGIAAYTEEVRYDVSYGEFLEKMALKKNAVVVVLDEIQDTGNFGAIIRSSEAFGVSGIVLPEHGSVKINDTVIKASAGAIEHIPITIATNLNNLIRDLKKIGFWVYGAEASGTKVYYEEKYPEKVCLVVGSEGRGIRKKVMENCDIVLTIPMQGKVNSLNASVAAGILLSEISKNRRCE